MSEQSVKYADLVALLHNRARLFLSCPHEAADLAQDTALRVWKRQSEGHRIENTNAYAMAAMRNLASTRWRSYKPCDELDETSAFTQPEAPARIACAELRSAILKLPPDQAVLMELIAGGDTRPSELARITGLPLGTVMSRLARARAKLRLNLGLNAGEALNSISPIN